MNNNLFGDPTELHDQYILYQDESACNVTKYFYIGFLFVRKKVNDNILIELIQTKQDRNRLGRDIHFNQLNQASTSKHGQKTQIAIEWIKKAKELLHDGHLRFYFFGIDKNNLKNFWINSRSFEKNIYLRFFEIGLKGSLRWFSKGNSKPIHIVETILSKGDFEIERKQRLKWLSQGFFQERFAELIDLESIKSLSSKEAISGSDKSIFLQLTDVLLGVCRSSFINLGKNQKGQQECTNQFIDVVERFNNKRTS